MAEAGLGAAIMARSMLPQQPSEKARALRIVKPEMERQIAIIRASNRELTPAPARLAELIKLVAKDMAPTASAR